MQSRVPLRRITTWLAILGYTLVASGLPLPFGMITPAAPDSPAAKRLAGKDRSQPFPCMDKPCGCATAEQCFTSCCCSTPAETLAWARARRVEPAVLAALEQRVASSSQLAAKATNSSCCSTKAPVAKKSCCTSRQPAAVAEDGDLCSMNASRAATPSTTKKATTEKVPPADEPAEPQSRSVTLRAMLACGGIVAEWFAAGAALPQPRFEVSLVMHVLDACTHGDEACESPAYSPTAPPPRAA
jgi:hypothetical protein